MGKKIKINETGKFLGKTWINVHNKGYSICYSRPDNPNDLKREGRSLKISTKTASFTLNGAQINTIKKVLQKAGEI